MKLKLLVAVIASFGFVLIAGNLQTNAAADITQEKITKIRGRCTENLAALNRLHQTDAFLRNDRGNLYRTISDRLMVPLNRRLAANRLDGGQLVNITADFNREYDKFYSTYIDYDNAMSDLLKIDCSKQPVAFYTALLETREKRTELSKINLKLKELIRQYGIKFVDFKTNFEKDEATSDGA
ncbi:MAG TPA: hypothetical protein PK096_00390 [Candidatus Saccharibacteria bacterium]|nr:hypothetical protein [Candidatus Saccharibacteria bacterium]HRK93814.1 hypothetical protein [Candidatus Saccharibacteria bacterium]